MKKTLVLDIDFKDGFTPPDHYVEPTSETNWKTPCDDCPFFVSTDDSGSYCCLDGDFKQECPIRKFFK